MTIDTVRDQSGRFVAGHAPTSPGRPKREQERMILDAISNALSPAEIEFAIREGLRLAIEQKSTRGIVAILELCAAYGVGRPTVRVESPGSNVIEEAMQSWIAMKQQAELKMR